MSPRLRLWWQALTQRQRFEDDLDAELQFHLDARSDDLIQQGLAPAEARRRARLELGMGGLHRDACRQARGLALFDTVGRDLRYALRGLLRNRGYSVTALLVLTVALAANALLFTLFSAYALRSPPLAQPDRWVTLEARNAHGDRLAYWTEAEADALLAEPSAGLESVYLLREVRLTVGAEVTRRASGESVSPNYFRVLGIPAARGRTFDDGAEEHRPLVLGHLGWQRLLGGDPDPLGREVTLAGEVFTVIGIMPPEFTGTTPLVAMYWIRDRDFRELRAEGHAQGLAVELSGLRHAGSSLPQASAALTARAQRWNGERDEALQVAMADVSARSGYLPASDVRDMMLGSLPIALAFALVLLVAAANLANLVLARFASRQRELAVRVAVGAPRRRLVAQLLTECSLLASVATLLGFGLAAVLLRPVQAALFALMGDFGFDLIPLRMDASVLLYTWMLAMLATLAFGVLPALLATAPWRRGHARPDLTAMQRNTGSRLRTALMVGQVAASVVLLVFAGLIAANARIIERTELGFDPARTIAVHAWPPTPALIRELESLPQVARVALTSRAPLTGSPHRVDARVDDRSEPLFVRTVDSPYFALFGIELLHGRALHRGDERGAMVAVVSARTAERLWPGENPIGKLLELPPQERLGAIRSGRFEVVGVVEDVVSAWFVNGLDASAVYLPGAVGDAAMRDLVVHAQDSSPATLEAITRACTRAATDQECELMPMLLAIRIQHLPFLAASTAAAALGWIALAISCIGLYGLVSYLVVQKRREIGVRLALGAQRGRVTRELLSVAARQIALGVAIGVPLAFALTRVVAAYTDTLRTFDLVSFAAIPLGLAALALLAAWLPARRSARIPPTEALRQD